MSLSGVVRRPDKGPLGSVEDVRRELSRAFPGVRFTLVTHQSPVEAGLQFSIFLRLWIALFSQRVRYPHWAGTFESGKGFAVEFYFEANSPVRAIRLTLYGQTTEANTYFMHLSSATGWEVKHPSF
jgi:hypothetical protein